MAPRPLVVGMLTCEQVIIEEKTRNVTPVNCFSQRVVTQIPAENLSFVVFALLVDGVGDQPLAVSIQRLDTLDEVYRIRSRYRFSSPLHEVRCVIRVRDCLFPVAGYYQITLLVGDEVVAMRKIQIVQKENAK